MYIKKSLRLITSSGLCVILSKTLVGLWQRNLKTYKDSLSMRNVSRLQVLSEEKVSGIFTFIVGPIIAMAVLQGNYEQV